MRKTEQVRVIKMVIKTKSQCKKGYKINSTYIYIIKQCSLCYICMADVRGRYLNTFI